MAHQIVTTGYNKALKEKESKIGGGRTGPLEEPKRWLVTGGCGFIGSSLVEKLACEDDKYIRIIDNLSVGMRNDLSRVCEVEEVDSKALSNESPVTEKGFPRVELVVGDILDAELAIAMARDIDVIVHLAANTGVGESVQHPRRDCMTNIVGTLNYLESARRNNVTRFIFASSGAPVGDCEPPVHEEVAPHPISPYGASKLAGEAYCSAYFRTYGIDTVCLRFGNVYGPGSTRKNSVVAKFIRKAILGETLEIYGDGKQTRDFIYIDDLIGAIRRAAGMKGVGGETFQIATNTETTVSLLVKQLLPMLSQAGITGVSVNHGPFRAGDMKRNFSDTSKGKKYLGWEPEVRLETGLQKTVDWFLSRQT